MTAATPSDARLYPAGPLLAASVAVFRENQVLLARRVSAPHAGCYSLPGGLVEPGEQLAVAALRELREEVAVEAQIVGFNQHVEVIERDAAGLVRRHYVIASFVARWVSGEGTIGPEADVVTWARLPDVAKLPTTDHLLPLLEAAWHVLSGERQLC